jgi:hypothetical protein
VLGALAITSWQVGWFGHGSRTGPTPVTEVPSSLPAAGVSLQADDIVLTPLRRAPHGAMSADQAIAAARHFADKHPFPATALEADLTFPGTIHSRNPIDHTPVWLVTFTSPKPVNVGTVGTSYVKHFSVALNATSGAFVRGFFTR